MPSANLRTRRMTSSTSFSLQLANIIRPIRSRAKSKSVASVVPARKAAAEQAQTSKRPASKDSRDADQTKAANEGAYLKNTQAIKEETARAVASVPSKGTAAPPASLQ